MIISGYTDDRLNQIKTFDKTQPYIVGINGVTNINYTDPSNPIPENISSVDYTIDDINYSTRLGKSNRLGFYDNQQRIQNTQTIYFFNSSGITQQEINVIKHEVEMGISEPPKIESEIFIDRQTTSVFERHTRMEEITTLEQLEEYRNGYYTIFNT